MTDKNIQIILLNKGGEHVRHTYIPESFFRIENGYVINTFDIDFPEKRNEKKRISYTFLIINHSNLTKGIGVISGGLEKPFITDKGITARFSPGDLRIDTNHEDAYNIFPSLKNWRNEDLIP